MHRGARNLRLDVCDYDKKVVCSLYDNQSDASGQATDVFVHGTRQNGWKELTFKIPSTCFNGEREEENYRLQYLVADYSIRLKTDNEEDYYLISEPRVIHSGASKDVEVTAGHISQLLKTKNLNLEFSDSEGNNVGTAKQLLNTILEGTSWSAGNVADFFEDDGVTIKVRSLVASAKTGAFMLIANLCEKFDAAPVYHGDTRTVDLVPLNPFSELSENNIPAEVFQENNALELNYGRNVSNVTRTLNTENLVTRLYAYGSYGDKTNGLCSLQTVEHTEYQITLDSDVEDAEFYFTDNLGTKRYFTVKNGKAGDILIWSDMDPTSKSYVWNETQHKNKLDVSVVGHNAWSITNIKNLLISNTEYTFSINGTTSYEYSLWLGDENGSTRKLAGPIGTGESVTFTTPVMTESYLNLSGDEGAGNESLDNILPQVEIGEKTSYVERVDENIYPVYSEPRSTATALTPEQIKVANRFDYLMDFTYYDKIGLLTDNMKQTLAEYQRDMPALVEIATEASMNLIQGEMDLSALAESNTGFLRLDVSSYGTGDNGEVVLNIRKTTYSDGVIYRTDYDEARRNYFSWYCAKELKDNGDIVSGTGSVIYVIHDTNPITWDKAYVKLIDGEQKTQDYSDKNATDPDTLTLWLSRNKIRTYSNSDRFYLFASNSVSGRMGVRESEIEALQQTLDQATKVVTELHPTYFVWDSDPAPTLDVVSNSYGWYYRSHSDTVDVGDLYFCYGVAGDVLWQRAFITETEPELVNGAYYFNLKSKKLFHGEPEGWIDISESDIVVSTFPYRAPNAEARRLSQAFSKVAYYCLRYDMLYKGIYDKYVYTANGEALAPGNYAIPSEFGFYWVFTTDKEITDGNKLWLDTTKYLVYQDEETENVVTPEAKAYDGITFPTGNIMSDAIFAEGTINSTTGVEENATGTYRSTYVSVYGGVDYTVAAPHFTRVFEFDVNRRYLGYHDVSNGISFKTAATAQYIRVISTSDSNTESIAVSDWENKLFVKDTEYTILSPITTEGDRMGMNGLAKSFADLADKCYLEYLPTYNAAQKDVRDADNNLKDTLGDLYREGYWQQNSYVEGDEDKLYADALENLTRISKPEATYEIQFLDLYSSNVDAGCSVLEVESVDWPDIQVTDAIHLIDEQIGVNCWAYIDTVDKCYDQPWRTTLQINTDLSLIGQRSFTDALSRIAEVTNSTAAKQTLYDRAAAISGAGTYAANRIEGTINANRTALAGGSSNWYTDPNGNIVFESSDGTSAMLLSGRGFGMANTKDEYGDWQYRTFGTGDGLVGSEISAFDIYAENITTGAITADKIHPSVGQVLEIGSNKALTLFATVDGLRPAGAVETQVSNGDGTYSPVGQGDSYIIIAAQEGQNKAHIDIATGGLLNLQGSELNLTANSEMNLTSGDFNVYADGHIHMESSSELELLSGAALNVESGADMNVKSGGDLNVQSGGNANIQSGGSLNVGSQGNMYVQSGGKLYVQSQGGLAIQSGSTFTVDSTNFIIDQHGNVTLTGTIHADAGDIAGFTISGNKSGNTWTRQYLYAGIDQNPTASTVTNGVYVGTDGVNFGGQLKLVNNKLAIDTDNFSINPTTGAVTISGNVTATGGSFGGWTLAPGDLHSGSGPTYVSLNSDPEEIYTIWAGATTGAYAPFSVTKAGELTAKDGYIANWEIQEYQLSSGATTTFVALNSNPQTNYAIWAGRADAERTEEGVTTYAPFYVKRNGEVRATAGSIGGWTLTDTQLYNGSGSNKVVLNTNGTYAIWAGSNTAANAPFSVTNAGAVKAVSGTVGGWTLADNKLHNGTGSTYVALDSGSGNYAIWAGDATNSSAPFSVKRDGTLTATKGVVGGWEITNGILHSGTDATPGDATSEATYVALDSVPTDTFAIWAGDSTASSAPFRVKRNGEVYLTKLMVYNPATESVQNFSSYFWRLYYHTVRSVSVENNTLTIVLDNGTTTNFKKAATAERVDGGVGTAYPDGDGGWAANGTVVVTFEGTPKYQQPNVTATIDVTDTIQAVSISSVSSGEPTVAGITYTIPLTATATNGRTGSGVCVLTATEAYTSGRNSMTPHSITTAAGTNTIALTGRQTGTTSHGLHIISTDDTVTDLSINVDASEVYAAGVASVTQRTALIGSLITLGRYDTATSNQSTTITYDNGSSTSSVPVQVDASAVYGKGIEVGQTYVTITSVTGGTPVKSGKYYNVSLTATASNSATGTGSVRVDASDVYTDGYNAAYNSFVRTSVTVVDKSYRVPTTKGSSKVKMQGSPVSMTLYKKTGTNSYTAVTDSLYYGGSDFTYDTWSNYQDLWTSKTQYYYVLQED